MEENELNFIKLNLKATQAHRIYWNGQYFNIEGILLLANKIQTREEAERELQNCSLIVKMTPFKDEFKAKLFSHILGEDREEESTIFAFTAKLNIFKKHVIDIIDLREAPGIVSSYGNSPLNVSETLVMKLSETEKKALLDELQKQVEGNMLVHLQEPFVCFFPEWTTQSWKERLPQNKKQTSLIPFQGLFPFSGAIERIYREGLYALDDLYCVKANCDCQEVNCIIITIDEQSGREVVHGGFKYQFNKKTFKNMPDFPAQFNAQEWFKQFQKNWPINLSLLFETRYHFLRKICNS